MLGHEHVFISLWFTWKEVPTYICPCWFNWFLVLGVNHTSCSLEDVMNWKKFPRYWPFVWGIHRSPVNSPHKGQWRGALIFSLICAWISRWVNTPEAGDLRRQRAHYDVIVMHIWRIRLIMCVKISVKLSNKIYRITDLAYSEIPGFRGNEHKIVLCQLRGERIKKMRRICTVYF